MYRSQKNIENNNIDYKALYEQEKRLKEQFQRKAQLSQLKYRKLAQSIHKKCLRCLISDENTTREKQLLELKQFNQGLNMTSFASTPEPPSFCNEKIIQNFAVFGLPESMLNDIESMSDVMEGELLYAAGCPSLVEQHAAKLSFPAGITTTFYSSFEAKQKAVQIISSSTSQSKHFIMSFENPNPCSTPQCQIRQKANPSNRLYAVCMKVEDYSLVPNWNADLIQSQKNVYEHNRQQRQQVNSSKALSCQQTDVSYCHQKQCSIAVASRVYCIFTYYPFFPFFSQLLKSLLSQVKNQRLLLFRQTFSNGVLAEIDSHFCLSRIKQGYTQVEKQISSLDFQINKDFEVKMANGGRIGLNLCGQNWQNSFVGQWGLSVLSTFSLDTFIETFSLLVLEQHLVFVCQSPTTLTHLIYLFTQLLPRPFGYPYPIINLLPQNEGYLETFCPFVYGMLGSKKTIVSRRLVQRYSGNTFVCVGMNGVEIVGCRKGHSKMLKILKNSLGDLWKKVQAKENKLDYSRRSSGLKFTYDEPNFIKDKDDLAERIVKEVNSYMNNTIMLQLPSITNVDNLMKQITMGGLTPGQDVHQLAFQKIKKECLGKSRDEFFIAMLDTQIVSTYLFR